jgi:dihydroneopterin aldolase
VAKPRKFDDLQAVGVQIERQRVQPRPTAPVLHLLATGLVPPHQR